MRHRTIFLVALLCGLTTTTRAAEPITLSSLLGEMVDREAMARVPAAPYRCLQASSYDRAQTDPNNLKTWFANKDHGQFLRTEKNDGRQEWVIMEHQGPGAVTRFWLPLSPQKRNQTIRFYFDGAKTPAIAVKFNELLSGRGFVKPPLAFVASDEQATEGVAGDLYLPIPFATGCKITLDELPFYYIINSRAYAPGTPVKTFAMADYEAAADALKQTAQALASPLPSGEGQGVRGTANRPSIGTPPHPGPLPKGEGDSVRHATSKIEPDKELSLDLPAGPQAVRTLTVEIVSQDAPQVLRSAVLEAAFDGEPAIWCPLGEFFGCGARLEPVEDWCRTVAKDGKLTARWIMPYQKSGRVAVKNLGKKAIGVAISAVVDSWQWDDRSMHFHANWRHQDPIETRAAAGTMDWNYIEATGQGVYVGDTLTVFSPSPAWYGEGDERVYVDGAKFPSHLGTGTEDYYGYAWGMARQFSSPFISMPRRDGPNRRDWRGYTTTSRLRLLDGIPFTRSLKLDMEIWDWAATKLAYSAGTVWYARPGATTNRAPMPAEAAAPLQEPLARTAIRGAIECEGMKIVGHSKGLAIDRQPEVLDWSDGTQLFVRAKKVGDFVELQFPAEGPESKKITLYATKSYDYGVLRFTVNGQPAGKDYDAWQAKSGLSGPIELGTFEPRDGRFVLRVEVVGANPAARGSKAYFGLDAVTLGAK